MKDKRRRPKHYDRPGKRPGSKPDAGGIVDQRQREADRVDIHQLTADELGVSREQAKTINFQTMYGVKGSGKDGPLAKRVIVDNIFNNPKGWMK